MFQSDALFWVVHFTDISLFEYRASCSRLRFLELVLKLESGDHIKCKDTEVVDCVAYRLEPLTDNSYNDLDGELIEPGPIQACVVPSGAQFFAGKISDR